MGANAAEQTAPLTILAVHNFYRQWGGEDAVFRTETGLLEEQGHRLIRVTERVDDGLTWAAKVRLGTGVTWSRRWHRQLVELIDRWRPDVAHVHNVFPKLSPAVYHALHTRGVPIVQTLHNFRLYCPGGIFFRDGRVCEDCLASSVPWPAVAHGCYRGSRVESALIAGALTTHRMLGTWSRFVSVYVALTEFARQKFVQAGLPEEKVVVKPNCIHPDPAPRDRPGRYVLFVGRLAAEKGCPDTPAGVDGPQQDPAEDRG